MPARKAINESENATEIVIKLDSPFRPSIRLKAFTTPTVAKIVNKMAKGINKRSISKPGIPSLVNQTLKNKIMARLETAEAIRRAFDDIAYPISSANPTEKTGKADRINQVICPTFRLNTTERGMKPNDKSGISTSILM